MPSTLIAPITEVLIGFDRIELIVPRSGRAGQVVDFVDFQPDRMDHVMPEQFEIRPLQQMRDVRLLAGEEIVDANHVVSLLDQPLAQVRAQETRPRRSPESAC